MAAAKKPTKRKPVDRAHDPRYHQILELVERCIAGPDGGHAGYAMISLSEMLYPNEDPRLQMQGWDIEAAGELVRTYARHMPEDMLDDVAARARQQMKELTRWETKETYFCHLSPGEDCRKVEALAKRKHISIAEAYAKFKVAKNLAMDKRQAELLDEAGAAAIAKYDAEKAA